MNLKEKITLVIRGLALCLALIVLAPSIVKFTHIFSHHDHELCENADPSQEHFHKVDLDCEFYKFKISSTTLFSVPYFEYIELNKISGVVIAYNSIVKAHVNLTTYLRGPPSLV